MNNELLWFETLCAYVCVFACVGECAWFVCAYASFCQAIICVPAEVGEMWTKHELEKSGLQIRKVRSLTLKHRSHYGH